ncbi:MAG: pseudaminic acid biosynthesis N-acetyl transferase [Firmicutes bacterium]|nr:pseudaminic acid biosynthesis N-acetyl transferase [Bacillota bacterium]
MLETHRLMLRLLTEQDEHEVVAWRNQSDIINNLFSYKGLTINEHRQWYTNYLKDDTRIEFVITVKESEQKIGTIGLSSIDYRNQIAEYGVLLGTKQERGKGYAQEASVAILEYAFSELNLYKIKLKVFTDNMDAVKMYQKLGFVKEGTLRREVYKNGTFKDVTLMAILKDEWVN